VPRLADGDHPMLALTVSDHRELHKKKGGKNMSEMVTSKESEQCYVAIRITFLSHKASAHQISILSVKLIEVIDTKLNWIVLPARPVEPIC
jgi:hypothetical protein